MPDARLEGALKARCWRRREKAVNGRARSRPRSRCGSAISAGIGTGSLGLESLDCGAQARPRHGVGQRCYFRQADRFAARQPIRPNDIEAPLLRVGVISVRIRKGMVRERINLCEAPRIGHPIRPLEIAGSRPDIEDRFCRAPRSRWALLVERRPLGHEVEALLQCPHVTSTEPAGP